VDLIVIKEFKYEVIIEITNFCCKLKDLIFRHNESEIISSLGNRNRLYLLTEVHILILI
jgi:hypothetical protein